MERKKVTVLVKRLVPEAAMPSRKHPDDAGADVTATSVEVVAEFPYGRKVLRYGTGLAMAVPPGYWIDLRPRSSIYRTGLVQCNSVGTIDAGYRGEVCQMFYYENEGGIPYEVGERIGQLVVMPGVSPMDVEFVEAPELRADNDRGGGFGSTGA